MSWGTPCFHSSFSWEHAGTRGQSPRGPSHLGCPNGSMWREKTRFVTSGGAGSGVPVLSHEPQGAPHCVSEAPGPASHLPRGLDSRFPQQSGCWQAARLLSFLRNKNGDGEVGSKNSLRRPAMHLPPAGQHRATVPEKADRALMGAGGLEAGRQRFHIWVF